MGAPELPNDAGERDIRPTDLMDHVPIASDESDNESMDAYMGGYQPLATTNEESMTVGSNVDNNLMDDTDDEMDRSETDGEPVIITADPNLPPIDSADTEITRQVWNEPRPQELQIELDVNRTEQIMNAMAGITLPNLSVPEWAAGVPEEIWKEDLLQRIRQRRTTGQASGEEKTIKSGK